MSVCVRVRESERELLSVNEDPVDAKFSTIVETRRSSPAALTRLLYWLLNDIMTH